MSIPDPPASLPQSGEATRSLSPLRCFTGTFIAGSLSMLLYRLMSAIAQTFASKPVISDNVAVVNISVAVRTLVVGMVALGAGVFGLAAIGLAGLGIQLIVKRLTSQNSTDQS